jgi:hypothetical protein
MATDWTRTATAMDSPLETIGNTPLLETETDVDADVSGKLEFFNPSGSTKDRIYREMITAAEERGGHRAIPVAGGVRGDLLWHLKRRKPRRGEKGCPGARSRFRRYHRL